jgi:hypothetical protein
VPRPVASDARDPAQRHEEPADSIEDIAPEFAASTPAAARSARSERSERSELSERWRRVGAALAGPALIVAAVLVVQHRFAFGGMLTNQHPDILAMWLPTHCFLGNSLAAGHIPAWNPYILGGTPSAADPQSGWMYLPAMLLSTALSCGTALRWFIVLQPLIAGLGMYGFLRSERLSRVAATSGGVVMALLIGGSYLGVQLPFAGALAWTTVLLFTTSRFVRTERAWPVRLGWLLAAAVAWGQIASAHLSNGLVVGTFAFLVYLGVAVGGRVRSGELSGRRASLLVGMLLVAIPLVNLAVLLPRLAYLPSTTSTLGYTELARRAAALVGKPFPPTPVGVTSAARWPLTLVAPIGGYAGAVAMALALAGWRRSKALFFGFGGLAVTCYLLSLEPVAQALSHVVGGTTVGDFYLHVPSRFSDGVVLATPVLVALGVDAWRSAASWRERAWLVAPGVALWWVLAPAMGIVDNEIWLPLAAAIVGAVVLTSSVRHPVLLVALPAVIAVELVVNGLLGQAPSRSLHGSIEIPSAQLGIPPLRRPEVNVADYLRAGPIAAALETGPLGRYTAIPPRDYRGLIPYQQPKYWPLQGNQRGVLFALESPDGVNPVQSVRHWAFVRASQHHRIYYNASFFLHLPPVARDLLQLNGVTIGTDLGCRPKFVGGPATESAQEGDVLLCRPAGTVPLVSVVGDWDFADSQKDALDRVVAEGFDPERTVVLERDPGIPPGHGSGGTATYRSTGPQSAAVDVRADGPAIVLIRNAFDRGWHATVDGHPAPLLAADFVDQAVVVPAGRHTIVLGYDDPWVGRGLLGTGLTVLAIGFGALVLAVRDRRRRGSGAMPSDGATPATPRDGGAPAP